MENTPVTPPPFKGDEARNVSHEQAVAENVAVKTETTATDVAASTNVADPLMQLGLDDSTAAKVQELLLNAETEGYLRGRNEKIEATQHFDVMPDDEPQPVAFPSYCRRSVWDE
ncbi:MAG: hypothetical protein J5565_06970 [Muribaculaceae bacterium]|nr:hypothetical protein [Muribaculaceae bacterium]